MQCKLKKQSQVPLWTLGHECPLLLFQLALPDDRRNFCQKAQTAGKENGVAVRCNRSSRQGSHGRIYYGAVFTTIKGLEKDIGPDLLSRMLTQLGVEQDDWE